MTINPKRAQELFVQALELTSPDQRAAYLAEQCSDSPELLERVERLLAAHDKAYSFLDVPTIDVEPKARPENQPLGHRIGDMIADRYKLLENIGEGGMGTVWVAEQLSPVKRRVAIKMIKPGMDSKQVLARFEAERQALALMDHPHIAKVFDGGVTDQGRPYFVMEYVKGVPFTEYCDHVRLPLRQRLELFIPVCQAVQHAHQKGIIHRDLKPSNILICLYDGEPVPKVIDFGLAKALHQPLTEKSIYTGHGTMVGTPLYMSPEQAEHNNLDVDTRTDIYSLGAVLYELLTGTTPLERQQLQQAALDEVLRLIREVEPQRPSLKLSIGDSLPSVAAQRSIDPNQLRRFLTGDLDWIVMKALEKERGRRYDTAIGLSRDIERFLNDEAVEATPPSTAYRLRKFVKKNRGRVAAACAVAAMFILGIIGTSVGLIREANQRKIAEKKTDEAEAANTRLAHQRDIALKAIEESSMSIYCDECEGVETLPAQAFADGVKDSNPDMSEEELSIRTLAYMTRTGAQRLREKTDAAEWDAYTANLALAQSEMKNDHWPEARERIALCPESKRGWEWKFLDLQTRATIWRSIRDSFSHVAFNPDRSRVLLWNWSIIRTIDNSAEFPLQIRNVDGLGHPMNLDGFEGSISSANWSPDGSRIFAVLRITSKGIDNATINVWNTDGSNKCRVLYHLENSDTTSAVCNFNGTHILTHGENNARVWNADGSGQTLVLDDVNVAKWSPEGSRIATVTLDGTIRVLNVEGAELSVVHPEGVAGKNLEWSLDGTRILVFSHDTNDNTACIVNADGSGEPQILRFSFGGVLSAKWCASDSRIAMGLSNGVALIWNVDETKEPTVLREDKYGIWFVDWSAGGRQVFTGSIKGLCVWDVATGNMLGYAIPMAFDRRWDFAATSDGSARLVGNVFSPHSEGVSLVSMDAWGGPDRILSQWDSALQSVYVDAIMSSVSEKQVSGLDIITPDGSRRIVADGRTIRFKTTDESNREVAAIPIPENWTNPRITNLQMTGDGTRLIIHLASGDARVWDIRDPVERSNDAQRAWAERVPAGAYLDSLMAGPTPTDKLLDVILQDPSLTPLRRLVTAELLHQRLAEKE